MTESAEHETQPDAAELPFSNDEWKKLQAQDKASAKAIVVLLTGLFVMGLILYIIVAIVVGA